MRGAASRHEEDTVFDVTQVAEAIAAAKNPDGAWHAVSNHLKAQGLHRTALHTHLPLAADNPFGDPGTGRAFGHVWDAEHDRKLRAYSGDVRRAGEPDLWGLRPTLKFLAMSRSPLFVDHRDVLSRPTETVFKPICRSMIENLGQYQGLALPLKNPATGAAAILSAWGDENRGDFSAFVRANMHTLHLLGHYFMGIAGLKWPGFGRDVVEPRLSDRERQVLSLLARGLTVAAVADTVRISDRSVTEYMLRARRKLGAGSKAQAIARAVYLGLIE
ncbi:MAG: hypothetical protein CL543_11580 [Alcanivorax sp.]|nr:hypothetical protein [Alcanivorax sp.]MAY09857.1 hypothetical protein [Alcanivorax sp.]MBI55943.1 hypothetical protein [Alcanivorax sp.]MBU59512.1 hypothetical protein [Alcanivorax sp.]HCE41743.1 hypothetical protein [Alcanivorax sp.]